MRRALQHSDFLFSNRVATVLEIREKSGKVKKG